MGETVLSAVQLLAGSTRLGFSIDPLTWLGQGAADAASDVWQQAMISLWSSALFLLELAFRLIDALSTPDLSSNGPVASILPTTLWIGLTVAVLLMFLQLATSIARRDGASIGRLMLGVVQFGVVWAGYLGVAAGFMAAANGLQHALLHSMLNIDTLSNFNPTTHFPRSVGDATLATVLGVLSISLVIPAAFFYLLIMLVREAAIVILIATAPISAAGLLNDSTKCWLWKSLRWYISCLLIAPTTALVLGIGVKLSSGVITGVSGSAAAAGQAVIGVVVIAIGAFAPMTIFRLLAFVEPGTASGAALRQSWSDAGGIGGVMGGGSGSAGSAATGSSAASAVSSDGRSGGESGAEAATQSRLSAAMGKAGGAMGAAGVALGAATRVANRAVEIGSDVLGQAGVGAPGYSMTPTDERTSRRSNSGFGFGQRRSGGAPQSGSPDQGGGGSGGSGDQPPSNGGNPGSTPGGAGTPEGDGGGQMEMTLPQPPTPDMAGGAAAEGGSAGAGAGGGAAAGGSAAGLAVVAAL